MLIVIDGYNVLKQIYGARLISKADRNFFLTQLQVYARLKQHTIIIVFDGGPYGNSDVYTQDLITVCYSGSMSADKQLICYVYEYRTQEQLLVSMDREITRQANDLGVPCIDSPLFYMLLQQTVKLEKVEVAQQKKQHKIVQYTHATQTPEIIELMKLTKITDQADKHELVQSVSIKKNTLSKLDQKLMKILEKL